MKYADAWSDLKEHIKDINKSAAHREEFMRRNFLDESPAYLKIWATMKTTETILEKIEELESEYE